MDTPKHFQSIVAIYSYFANSHKLQEQNFPQSIRIMEYSQLYDNIIHERYQTQLIKDIIVYLLRKYIAFVRPKYETSCLSVLKEQFFQYHRERILDRYYAPLAINQFLNHKQSDEDRKEYNSNIEFYQLELNDKIQLLQFFIERISIAEKGNISKIQNSMDNQVLLLGDCEENLYFFIKFMPWAIHQYNPHHQWEQLSFVDATEKVQRILQLNKSYKNLFLMKNMLRVMNNYMCKQKPESKKMPLHKLCNPPSEIQVVQELKANFKGLISRYSTYIMKINQDYSYASPQQQNKIESMLEKCQDFQDLITACTNLFETLKQGIYVNPSNKNQDFQIKYIKWASLFAKPSKFSKQKKIQDTGLYFKLLTDKQILVIHKPILQMLGIMLENRMNILEIKQEKHFKIMGKKLQRQLNKRNSVGSVSSLSESLGTEEQEEEDNDQNFSNNRGGMQLRKRVKTLKADYNQQYRLKKTSMQLRKKPKKFGITMVDSDDEYSSIKKKLRGYEYTG